ncbi:hypothetical protein [Halobacillus sp. B23F22_1]|uniref:hypothetical protein n=1 Tax=Halobacillus sp. B23F22_1 TaxID=3459514 RepID=UPI00373FB0D3
MNSGNFKKTSEKLIDMLVGSTLKRHKVALNGDHLSNEEKEQLRSLVEELKQNVESLQQKDKEDK